MDCSIDFTEELFWQNRLSLRLEYSRSQHKANFVVANPQKTLVGVAAFHIAQALR